MNKNESSYHELIELITKLPGGMRFGLNKTYNYYEVKDDNGKQDDLDLILTLSIKTSLESHLKEKSYFQNKVFLLS